MREDAQDEWRERRRDRRLAKMIADDIVKLPVEIYRDGECIETIEEPMLRKRIPWEVWAVLALLAAYLIAIFVLLPLMIGRPG